MTSLFIRALLATAVFTVPVATARAAFEFIPPAQVPAAPVASPSIPAPAASQPPVQSGMTMAPAHVPPAPSMPTQTLVAPTPAPAPYVAPAPAPVAAAPAPASSVVGQALDNAWARTSPQSILPAGAPPSAPVSPASQYAAPTRSPSVVSPIIATPAPSMAPAPIRTTPSAPVVAAQRPQAVGSAPAINMNPLGLTAASQPAAPAANVEQAMMQAAVPPVSAQPPMRSSYGGMPIPSEQPSGFAEAVGFGRDLPLALAVSQIVPPDYAFSFDQSVSPGESISWEGGKPWDQALNDALRPVGASARIDTAKKEITIVSGSSGGVVPAAYTAPAPQVQAPRPPVVASAPVQQPAYAPAPVAPMPVAAPVQEIAPLMAAPPVAIPTVLDTKATNVWQAERGMTLRKILEDWSMRAGVELFWSSDYDYPVSSSVRISGTFEDAVQTLLNGLRDAQPRPIGRLHPNLPDGPSVLVVETKHILQ